MRAIKLKKYNGVLKPFVLILTFALFLNCGRQTYYADKAEGREIAITNQTESSKAVEDLVKPYRENIDRDLSTVLAYAPQTLDKSGEWQTSIGNVMADQTLQRASRVLEAREKIKADICLLNYGGIRSIIPKGDVTTRTAFEIMPFENSVVVAALNGEQILEMLNYIISEKKAHPLAGMSFKISADNKPVEIIIGGKPFDSTKTYYVVTSDYLLNGGDKMDFFKKATATFDLDYKLRNVLIDYFKDADTISAPTDVRISRVAK